MDGPRLISWSDGAPPAGRQLAERLRTEGLAGHTWSNGRGDMYAAHSHTYHKILYCVTGSITFRDEVSGRKYELGPGDRLEIPAGTVHSARVGPHGCSCVEGSSH